MKAKLVRCVISSNTAYLHWRRAEVRRLVFDAGELGTIAITPEDGVIHVVPDYDMYRPNITLLGEVDLPDELVEKVVCRVRAQRELNALAPQVRACMTD